MMSLTSGIPKYYIHLLSSTDRLLARTTKFNDKFERDEITSKKNCKTVPSNATIRVEQIKCGKPLCCYCPHGPYYYAYWKEGGKLRKKYIGTRYEPVWKNSAPRQVKTKSKVIISLANH